ncbi:major facilitator superfamily protein [Planococcus antarcticus DSM 14505]|uniref:MFS transporter n=1 Tax=Planococcus antarcticus DSM 14505 TaxID=1185653 RepID=A0A1C7DJS1_9BACL|nr:MFS transporter [Planococcus antarcticus]ANU11521.1 MFS transporter [Planococcus antarcticus DSM 14505]EIM08177.1 major facilitator superfamily protein [Planococcus antarcticus DSM 14505]
MDTQKKNFVIIMFTNFLVAGSTTMIMPFLSLYIESLGNFTDEYVQRWSGLIFGITFVAALIMSPIWGRIADKYGFKPILIINGFGIATSIFLMGTADSVSELFMIRLFMGVVTGFIPTSLAFVSSQTSKETAGKTLGTLQMGSVSGTLFGPVLGGLMADAFGFEYTFLITASVIAIAALFVVFGLHEIKRVKLKDAHVYAPKTIVNGILSHRLMLNVMIITALIQIGNFSIQPLLSLYVAELTEGSTQVAFLAGITFSATGVGNLLFARRWGRLGDSIGYEKVLGFLLLLAFVFIIPQAFVTELWQLIALRLLFGIAVGGMIPTTTALMRREAPIEIQGEIMGYNTSFRFLGNIIGPMFGGIVSGFIGISSVFIVTGVLFVLAFAFLRFTLAKPQQDFEDVLLEQELKNT